MKILKRLFTLLAIIFAMCSIGICFHSIIETCQQTGAYTPIVMLFIISILMAFGAVFINSADNSDNKILFAKTRPDATIPSRKRGNAGFDIYGVLPKNEKDYTIIHPHETKLIPTGIKSIIPDGYYVQIEERGSTGSKGIKYSAGVIDSSYRGEWFLAVTNTNDKPVVFYDESFKSSTNIEKPEFMDLILYPLNKAIFQGVIHSTHDDIMLKEVSLDVIENDVTERGEGKLGSSGK